MQAKRQRTGSGMGVRNGRAGVEHWVIGLDRRLGSAHRTAGSLAAIRPYAA